jgi:hypothetical protein
MVIENYQKKSIQPNESLVVSGVGMDVVRASARRVADRRVSLWPFVARPRGLSVAVFRSAPPVR